MKYMKTLAEKIKKVITKKLGKEKKVDLLAGPWGVGYDAGYAAALKEVLVHIDLLDIETMGEELTALEREREFWATK